MSGLRHRRDFLKTTGKALAIGATVPYWFSSQVSLTKGYESANDRPVVGIIACGSRGETLRGTSSQFGDIAAVCDPNLTKAEAFAEWVKKKQGGKEVKVYQDYRKLLEQKDIEVVTNATPEHWHAKVMVDTCRSGRDIFTEKPLSATIDEAKYMRKVVEETNRIVQVGSQQRSREEFVFAVKLVHEGRIGKLQKVYATVPFRSTLGGPFETSEVPAELDYDLWQGPAAAHPYITERVKEFRHWQEYSGGIYTDWGQHQMDVAFWGMKMDESGPLSVEGKAVFPNPKGENYYNHADRVFTKFMFPGNLEVLFFSARDENYEKEIGKEIKESDPDLTAEFGISPGDAKVAGILFFGEKGRILVNRKGVRGVGADEYKPTGADGNTLHMKNFFDCVKSRQEPLCPVRTASRVINACLLANIAIRHDRKINWDPVKEEIVGDEVAANSFFAKREDRSPYLLKG